MNRSDLIAAVLADPDALWAVLTSGVKVAGPWTGEGNRFRHAVGHTLPVASVVRLGYGPTFQAFAARDSTPAYPGVSKAEAESWCDERLRADGYLLAGVVTA